MGWFRRRHVRPEPRDLNDPDVHMPGTFIDSWFNMPGGQPDDDDRPSVSELKGWKPGD